MSFSRYPWVLGLQPPSLRSPAPHKPRHHHLRCASCFDKFFVDTTVIDSPQSTQPWKSCTQWSLHTPSYAAQRSSASITCLTHWPLFLLTSSVTSLSPCHLGLTSSSILCWRHPPHQLTSLLTDRWSVLTLTVDFLQSKCFLPNFLRRFHFCSLFLHILLPNEE